MQGLFDDVDVFSLRSRSGDDASCLNLYQPSRPTLLGATAAMISRGGFGFNATLAASPEEEANPWLILEREFPGGDIQALVGTTCL